VNTGEVEATTELEVLADTDFAIVLRNVESLPPGAYINISIIVPGGEEVEAEAEKAVGEPKADTTKCPSCGLNLALLPERPSKCPRCDFDLDPEF
jgi:hypothetical protein